MNCEQIQHGIGPSGKEVTVKINSSPLIAKILKAIIELLLLCVTCLKPGYNKLLVCISEVCHDRGGTHQPSSPSNSVQQ